VFPWGAFFINDILDTALRFSPDWFEFQQPAGPFCHSMKPTPPLAASGPKPKASRFDGFWPAVLIVLAGAAAYANSFSGPFIFDDRFAIAGNS
jgi:hypothetical protein